MSNQENNFQRKEFERYASFYEARCNELKYLFQHANVLTGLAGIYLCNNHFTMKEILELASYCEQWRLVFIVESHKGAVNIVISKNVLDL